MCENQYWEMLVVIYFDYVLLIVFNEIDELKILFLDLVKEGGNEFVGLIEGFDKYFSDFLEICCILFNSLCYFVCFDEWVDDFYVVYVNVCNVCFNEMEYLVFVEYGFVCLWEIFVLICDKDLCIWFFIEYCYVKVDDIFLSMFEGCDSCFIFVYQYYSMDYYNFFVVVELIFWKYVGWLYWGKLYGFNVYQLQGFYLCWKVFVEVCQVLDFCGWFFNVYFFFILGVI